MIVVPNVVPKYTLNPSIFSEFWSELSEPSFNNSIISNILIAFLKFNF